MSPDPLRTEGRSTRLWLLLAVLLAFWLRTPGLLAKLGEHPVRFIGPDPYYHLRRAELAVRHFPAIPGFDYYLGYPKGGNGGWPPFFELLAAGPALALGAGHPTPHLLEACGALLPPLLGSLTVLLAFALGRLAAGRTAGVAAAVALALLPAHAFKSALGYFDHDVAAVFFAAGFFFCLLKAEGGGGEGRAPRRWSWLAGGSLALGMLSWTGFTLFAAIAALYAALEYLRLHLGRADDRPLLRAVRNAFALAALALLPFAFISLADFAPLSFAALTLFQPLLFTVLALLAECLRRISLRVPPGAPGYRGMPMRILIGLGATAVLTALLAPAFLLQAWKGVQFLGGRDPWLKHIPEFEPLLVSDGRLDLAYAGTMLGGLGYLWPLLSGLLFWRRAKNGEGQIAAARLWLGVSLATLSALALFENRHAMALALPLAVAYGVLFDRLQGWCRSRSGRSRRIAAALLASLLGIGLCWPALRFYPLPDRRTAPGMQRAFLWLRDHTPPTGFYEEPDRQPEYGVLAPPEWYGHHLVYLARRPALGTPFGHFVYGFREAAEFYLAETEERAIAVLAPNRTRYLVLLDQLPCFEIYTDLLGRDASRFLSFRQGPEGRLTVMHRPYFGLIQNRLFYFDGRDTGGESLRRFRLLWESAERVSLGRLRLPACKIFERMAGAELTGPGRDGETVRAELPLLTNSGRRLLFSAAETVSHGRFRIVVPYATGANGATRTGAAYRIGIGGRPAFPVTVSEAQVREGAVIALDGAAPSAGAR